MKPLGLEKIAAEGLWQSVDLSFVASYDINDVFYGEGHQQMNLIGIAAEAKKLPLFPIHLITRGGLTKKNLIGESAMHIIAKKSLFYCLLPEHFSDDTLGAKAGNREGTTPLHYAALHCCYDQIPLKYHRAEVLKLENRHSFGVLDFAVFGLKSREDNSDFDRQGAKYLRQVRYLLSRFDKVTLECYLTQPITNTHQVLRNEMISKELKTRALKSVFSSKGLDRVLELDLGAEI